MTLYLDTTQRMLTIIRLDGEEFSQETGNPSDQNILGLIVTELAKKGRRINDITEIKVNPGPGSFTGTRVGVAIANALAFALKIKVNGQEPPVIPIYSSPPSITISKK